MDEQTRQAITSVAQVIGGGLFGLLGAVVGYLAASRLARNTWQREDDLRQIEVKRLEGERAGELERARDNLWINDRRTLYASFMGELNAMVQASREGLKNFEAREAHRNAAYAQRVEIGLLAPDLHRAAGAVYVAESMVSIQLMGGNVEVKARVEAAESRRKFISLARLNLGVRGADLAESEDEEALAHEIMEDLMASVLHEQSKTDAPAPAGREPSAETQ
jgi:hypothetical protein